MDAAEPDLVFLARHGETTWNRQGRRQGQRDAPLTRRGIRQALRVARVAVGLPVDAVLSSPLGRARATAEIVAARLGLLVDVLEDLREVDHGRVAGLTAAQVRRDYPRLAVERAADRYRHRFPGGESYADADTRAQCALQAIAAMPGRRPLIVSHEMIGRMLLRQLAGRSAEVALEWSHPHDVLYRVDLTNRSVEHHCRAGGPHPGVLTRGAPCRRA